MTLRTLNYGNYGIVPILVNAGFVSSTVTLAICRMCVCMGCFKETEEFLYGLKGRGSTCNLGSALGARVRDLGSRV